MCMCRPVISQAVMIGPAQAIVKLLVPDAVLRLLAAGVGLLAMAVAEARVDPQRDAAAGRSLAELIDHVGRAAIDVQAQLDDQIERLAIEDVGRVDDRRRIAVRLESGGQRPADFARADGIDQHAVAAHQVENRQIRAGLLGVADDVERPQIVDPLDDLGRVVNIGRRAELPGQLRTGTLAISARIVGKEGIGAAVWSSRSVVRTRHYFECDD